MKTLSQSLVSKVQEHLKGNKLNKFNASVKMINDSLAQGAWLKGASRSANAGFHQGSGIKIGRDRETYKYKALSELYFSMHYGYPVKDIEESLSYLLPEERKKLPVEFAKAWMELCNEKTKAIAFLDAARPKPVITAVGLSPKVTTTLKEMNLDIDLSTIKMAEIDFVMVDKKDINGEVVKDKNGKVIQEREYFVKWSEGIKHGQSRFFAGYSECEACGKNIPSGRFVPIEAVDKKKNQLVSLWLGCDCAKNIFGVKDIGLKRQ